jgi:hypothetical protein
MKMLLKQAFVRLNRKALNQLTAEVKETIFVEPGLSASFKTFTSAELWRIQRLKRPVSIRQGFSL